MPELVKVSSVPISRTAISAAHRMGRVRAGRRTDSESASASLHFVVAQTKHACLLREIGLPHLLRFEAVGRVFFATLVEGELTGFTLTTSFVLDWDNTLHAPTPCSNSSGSSRSSGDDPDSSWNMSRTFASANGNLFMASSGKPSFLAAML